MFSTVRYFVKTSIVFLVSGIITGLFMIVQRIYFNIYPSPDFISAHTHIILVGSVVMMIMGVALWFFPRAEKEDKFYKPELIRAVYYLLTISTSVRFVSQLISAFELPGELLRSILLISAFGQVIGIILFFISIWGRIRSVGSHIREAKGEKF